jgi:hypothetical protein
MRLGLSVMARPIGDFTRASRDPFANDGSGRDRGGLTLP